MNIMDKKKLEHDFSNALVIINSMAKSASGFVHKLSKEADHNAINQNQMDRFSSAMDVIQGQTLKLESYFKALLSKV